MKTRGRPISREGIELRKAIRADVDANPATTHQDLQREFGVAQLVVESAMTRTVAEWDACAEKAIEPPRETQARSARLAGSARAGSATPRMSAKRNALAVKTTEPVRGKPAPARPLGGSAPEVKMPSLEQGFVKFIRKPAKMGDDYIFWIPRVYIKNGLVDPEAEYEIFLRKVPKKEK